MAYLGTMNQSSMKATVRQPPEVHGSDARTELVNRARGRTTVPLRKSFVQKPRGAECRHGPLKEFVANGDLRGLRGYLIIVAGTSQENEHGWTTTLDSAVWARLMDIDKTASLPAARTGAIKTLRRLEDRKLVRCSRARGSTRISVSLLREDGTGDPYTRPDGSALEDRFLRLPPAFWTGGTDARLDMPGLAMLLTIAREKPWSRFPAKRVEQWYGWSEETTLRGIKTLLGLGLIERREAYEKAPLSPTGVTMVHEIRLVKWMRPPVGRRRAEAKP
jgi:hypothetical protein